MISEGDGALTIGGGLRQVGGRGEAFEARVVRVSMEMAEKHTAQYRGNAE